MKEETLAQLQNLLSSGDIDRDGFVDVLFQASLFAQQREELKQRYPDKVVAFCADKLFYADNFIEVWKRIREICPPNRPFYAEKFLPISSDSNRRTYSNTRAQYEQRSYFTEPQHEQLRFGA
jgi:hypothetical protein